MDDRTIQIRVGVVVVTAAVIAFLLVLFFGEKRSPFQKHKTIYLLFPQAPGVSPQTPVRKNGVLIGRVVHVELRDVGDVVLTTRIEPTRTVLRNEVPRISTASLFGDAVVEFVPGDDKSASREEIGDEEFITNGIVTADPLRVLVNLEGKIRETLSSIEVAGNEVTLLSRNMNTIVGNNQDQFQRVIQKSELAMEHFRSAMETVDEVIGDPELKANLKQSLQDFPQLLDDARTTLADARTTLSSFQTMSNRANSNLENLEKFTKPLAERGPQLADRIDNAVGNIDALLDQLVQFSSQLNSREGTLGQLLYDKDLYTRVHRTAVNLEDATRQLKPIMADIRVFADKAATDPRVFGIKGALDQRPLGVGAKHKSGAGNVQGLHYVEDGVWIEDFEPQDVAQPPLAPPPRSKRIPWRPGSPH